MAEVLRLSKVEEERAREIHERSIFINSSEATHIEEFDSDFTVKLRQGGVTGVAVTVAWVENDFKNAILDICDWTANLDKIGSGKVFLATEADDIVKAKQRDLIATIFSLQNAQPIEDDTRFLTVFHQLGVRIIGLTYQRRNYIGDGCGERVDCGISKFGIQVVEEMNRLGLLIDLSHVGPKTSLEAIEISKSPMVFSHSGVRSLTENIRNITDEQIKAMSEKGGVVGIIAYSPFLRKDGDRTGSTIEDYLDHIDHVVKLVGANHVGIGTDIREEEKVRGYTKEKVARLIRLYPELEGFATLDRDLRYTRGLWQVTESLNITRGLVVRGYSDKEIKQILGENFLGIFRQVWKPCSARECKVTRDNSIARMP